MTSGGLSISRWLGEFVEPADEAAFLEDARPRLIQQLRWIAAVQGALYLAAISYHGNDYGQGFSFWILLWMRLGIGFLMLVSSVLARPSRPLQIPQWLYFVGGTLLLTHQVAEYHVFWQMTGAFNAGKAPFILMIVLMTYIVAPVPMWMAITSTLVGSLCFLGYQLAISGPWATATRVVFIYMLLANGVGYAFRVAWNRITRRDFALRRELEREVTERQHAEGEAHRANAAKGRFLAVMSHEIRTPLNGILGGAQLLQETALGPDQRQLLELLARSGNQLAMLLDDVLDLARIEAGHLDLVRAPFSPAELLASVHAVLYSQARAKGLTFRLEHGKELPQALMGDALRLRQVLINLLGNAVKFTEHGEVVLSLGLSEMDGQPGFLRCAFAVRDTGPGLDADAMARVFAPFEQGDMSTHRRHGGAGLGLAISRELVAAMGGELGVESTLGEGSTFGFSLALPLGEIVETAAPASTGFRSLSVLVVDDLEANLIVAKGLLASLGHRARTVATGAAALEALQTDAFDAVLLDLHMEDMDGLEVLQHIRSLPDRRTAAIPVFLVTADAEQSRLQACLAAGMQGVLPKPIRKARLAALLAGVASVQEVVALPESSAVPLVDAAHVAQILDDLGPETWEAGLRACRHSAEACLEELRDPARAAKALHRLAGLSASYGLSRLHLQIRHAETLLASGAPCPADELITLMAASLDRLEARPILKA